jgi:hypothetical protein
LQLSKIKLIFAEKKMKFPRTYHFDFSPGTDDDDKILFDLSELLGDEIVLTEKLDGENTCLKEEGAFSRSHASPSISPWATEVRFLWDFYKSSLAPLSFYGENMQGVHSIEYSDLESPFYLFAIYDEIMEVWLSWDEVKEFSEILGIPHAPELSRGSFDKNSLKEEIERIMSGGSRLGGEIEGVVARKIDRIHPKSFYKNVVKYRREGHVKTDEHWTKNWKEAKFKYRAYQLIEKHLRGEK